MSWFVCEPRGEAAAELQIHHPAQQMHPGILPVLLAAGAGAALQLLAMDIARGASVQAGCGAAALVTVETHLLKKA